jgi:hypothetical protein
MGFYEKSTFITDFWHSSQQFIEWVASSHSRTSVNTALHKAFSREEQICGHCLCSTQENHLSIEKEISTFS